ncbi:hypothetical protein [Larsenimonas salina]|uniref:hypothetical protein n=1 Tax=Larsenimonas salina TaxID=1295565 RepID=UPI0020735759|nr:hypothetical protein [Larsenimonas salina]MCM5704389.1 hypothetical protein [Larsenimonas salina]
MREAGTRAQVKQRILPSPSAEVSAKFDELNTHLPDYVLPGTLVVLSDPENTSQMCTQQEEELRQQAVRAQQTVQWLELPEAQALVDHYGPLRDFSLAHNDEMSDGSTWVGVASAAGEHFMETVQKELEHIHSVYVSASERMSARFEAMRQSAFKRIDAAGEAWTNVKLEIVDDVSDLKGKIGVAGGVAVSKTQTALKSFIDYEIPSVSEAIGKAGVVVKGLSLANYAAVIVDYYATDARVAKACSESRESECMRVTVKEYGGLMGRIGGGTLGSIAGGAVDARYGQVLCGVVGVHPAGRLVCGAAVIGSGAYFGGAAGGDFLGGVAERVYLQVQDDDKRVDNADD